MIPSLLIAIVAGTVSSSVPALNMESVCREQGTTQQVQDDFKQCMDIQTTTKAQLERDWASYPRKERDHCAQVIRDAPEATYVELITCIDIQIPHPNANIAPPIGKPLVH